MEQDLKELYQCDNIAKLMKKKADKIKNKLKKKYGKMSKPIREQHGDYELHIYERGRGSEVDEEAFRKAHPLLAKTWDQIQKTRENFAVEKTPSTVIVVNHEEDVEVDVEDLYKKITG